MEDIYLRLCKIGSDHIPSVSKDMCDHNVLRRAFEACDDFTRVRLGTKVSWPMCLPCLPNVLKYLYLPRVHVPDSARGVDFHYNLEVIYLMDGLF